ncbi:MAG TPA: hypothetical protein VGQ76_24300 [Thermoanaerobaculia bacterium]|jgi:hypothetical protein|nr:hypothetical protein [Thermoanaerobaculia bacterium]
MTHLRETIRKPPLSDKVMGAVFVAVVISIVGAVLVATKGCTDMRTGPQRKAAEQAAARQAEVTVSVRPEPYKRIQLAPREWSPWMKPPVGASKRWYYETQPPKAKTLYEVEFSRGEVREFYGGSATGRPLADVRRARYRNVSDGPVTLLFFCDCADQAIAGEVETERDNQASREADRPSAERSDATAVELRTSTVRAETRREPAKDRSAEAEENPCVMGLSGVGPMEQYRRCQEWKKRQKTESATGEWTLSLAVGEELLWYRRGRNGEIAWTADGTIQVVAFGKQAEGRRGSVEAGTQNITFVNMDQVPVTVTLKTAGVASD